MNYGFISLLPPLIAIIFAFLFRKIVPSLFVGIFVGALITTKGHILNSVLKTFENYIIPSLGSPWNATIIIYGAFFGGFISLLKKNGGATALGEVLKKKSKNKKRAELLTACLGISIFFDDYFNCLTVGSVMKPLTDKMKVSREKLAYIIDSTAAPICLLIPLSTWVVFVLGLIGKENVKDPFILVLKTIPYNFYSWIAIFLVFFFILFPKFNFGPMKKAEKNVKEIQKINSEIIFKKPPHLYNLFLPFFVMIMTLIFMFLYTGGYFENDKKITILMALQNTKGAFSVLISVFLGGLVSLFLGVIQKYFSFSDGLQFYIDGMKEMFLTAIILILAWSMGSVIKELGTGAYVGHLLELSTPKIFIPALIFIIGAFISFTTGTAYGTFAIVIPIVFEIHFKTNISLPLLLAASLSGGVFGDHSSPLSDTTILASAGAECEHIEHVRTQLPYALLGATLSIIFFILVIFLN